MSIHHKYSSYRYALTYSHLDRARDLCDSPFVPIEFRVPWGRYNDPEHRRCKVHPFYEQDREPDPLPTPHDSLMIRATTLSDHVRRCHGRAAS